MGSLKLEVSHNGDPKYVITHTQMIFQDILTPISRKINLRMTDHIFWIGVVGHFQFQTSHVRITAQGPKMCCMHSVDALNLLNL